MRIVLKPAGLLFFLASFLLLIVVAVWRGRTPPPVAANSPARVAQNAPAAPSVQASLPPDVLLMPDITSSGWQDLVAAPAEATISVVDASVPGHPHARQINVRSITSNAWDVQIARPLSVPLKKGKRIRLTFWGRSKNSCPVTAVVEQNAEPFTKIIFHTQNMTPEWKQYTEEWTQGSDTPANWAKMDFHVAHKVGEVELTGVIIRVVPSGAK